MAYYNPKEDEQEGGEEQAQGGMQIGPQTATISSGSGATTNAPASNPSQNAPDRGSNFVGLRTYLDANKPQSEKLGGQVAGVIDQSANQAREGVNALNTEAQEKVKGTQSLGSDILGKIQTGAEALSADERQTAKNTANAQYKGPNSAQDLAGYQSAMDATKKATQNIDQSGTEQGRMALLGQVNDKRRGSGIDTFDNALLQAGGGREKLIQSSQNNADVKSGLENAATGINSQIGRADDPNTPDIDESAGAIGQTNKAQADAYKAIQDSLGAWKQGFDPKVKQAQDALVAQQNAVTSDLGNDQLSLDQGTLDALGLSAGQNVYGLNLTSYLNPANVSDINASNVASQEDYARYAALADLAGEQSLMLNPADASKAGTAPKFSANTDKLKGDLSAADQAFKQAYTAAPAVQSLGATGQTAAMIDSLLGPGKSVQQIEQHLEMMKAQHPGQVTSQYYNALMPQIQTWKKNQGYANTVKKNA